MSFSKSLLSIPESKNADSSGLQKENQFLKSQIEMLKHENQRILEMHCREKELMKNNLQEVQQRLVKERRMYTKDILELNSQLEALKQSVNRMLIIRNQQNSNSDEYETELETIRASALKHKLIIYKILLFN